MGINEELRNHIDNAVKNKSIYRISLDSGVPYASLFAWWNGSQKDMAWSNVAKLCNYLGLTLKKRGQ